LNIVDRALASDRLIVFIEIALLAFLFILRETSAWAAGLADDFQHLEVREEHFQSPVTGQL